MVAKKILVLSGDGIGPEQTEQTIRVIEWFSKNSNTKFELERGLLGCVAVEKTGVPLPDETLKMALEVDAVLKAPIGAAVGDKKWEKIEKSKTPEAGLLAIRKGMGLYANLRPAIVFEELVNASTLKPEVVIGLDIMILRELTGGLYFGEPKGITQKDGQRYGFNTLAYTEKEIERIVRYGFELAKVRNKKLCSVHKANVLDSMVLWRDVTNEVAKDYPDVVLTHMYVDNCAMQLVRNPKQFDVLVTENMFGDILSDLASMMTGSLGMLPSASLGEPDENGKRLAMYEPVHGAANDIAGQNKANPLSMILSFGLMLKYSFNLHEESEKLTEAVKNTLKKYRTGDIFVEGTELVGTKEMGDAILKELELLK
ncbi:MAG: 3-isopropylmalate dehydrogenase [Rickettsiales bacterium]|jgi:3-isopropylmalate dehydrogenase|nr:3-isopropylmalate dehydrogenase [Rickettsiales bacterium]